MILSRSAGLLAICLLIVGPAGPVVGQPEPEYSVEGSSRVRFENLDGQFRQGLVGSDQVLAMRTLVQGNANFGRWTATGELQDSRAYLDDAGSAVSTSLVNSMEIIQASVTYHSKTNRQGLFAQWQAKLGRFTLDIGSRRFTERNGYRNTINTHSGVHWIGEFDGGAQMHAFYVAPDDRKPSGRTDLIDNRILLDNASDTRRFWGVHYERPAIYEDIQLDVFVYGLNETDGEQPTLDRSVFAPGFRLLRSPHSGEWDFEIETAIRRGQQSISTAAESDTVDVRAAMLHAQIGYTFASAWNHRLSLEFNLATGDDAQTSQYERYDRFYGTRRGDLGNTSIHGPITRSNASIMGIRYRFTRGRTDGRIVVQNALLESATDQWITARHQDASGGSGREIGQTLDFRVRHWLKTDRLRFEVGGSALLFGEFVKSVSGGPEGARTLYGYSQIELFF